MDQQLERYNRYLSYYSDYIVNLEPTLLVDRDSRDTPLYRDYVDEVKEQRRLSPNEPKHDPAIFSLMEYEYSIPHAVRKVMEENYLYVGTRRIPRDIYGDEIVRERDTLYNNVNMINDVFISGDSLFYREDDTSTINNDLYWEFVDIRSKDQPESLSEWKFMYIPIKQSLTQPLSSKLPFIMHWDVRKRKTSMVYPDSLYLIDVDADQWPFTYYLVPGDMGHPFLGDMIFTGRTILQADSSILYEYTDVRQYYGPRDALYVSPLRPTKLDYPLGRPKPGDLHRDICMDEYLGMYPSYGESPYIGAFTGYKTTPDYNPYTIYYLYERRDGSTFLHEAPPYSYARAFINLSMSINKIHPGGLLIQPGLGLDSILIEDRSLCGALMSIPDKTCLPRAMETPLDNCHMIGDQFIYSDDRESDRACKPDDSPNCLVDEVNMIGNEFILEDCIDVE